MVRCTRSHFKDLARDVKKIVHSNIHYSRVVQETTDLRRPSK
jgi:hypothetical protein